ncbi:UvrD-helicase domain-containing protein [Acinetobacter pittii]|uniref:UvrD-helicase domain-containing protein n=1 Tax=Acinetobacter pittii TaxID=48296 RepID=UPI001F1D71EF|nr:UvrD-helicase domain-containing protein [Acinetobacter pittii]MCF1283215.1 UvrD-helicase domain-containing protein [Acinetobacter pittii]
MAKLEKKGFEKLQKVICKPIRYFIKFIIKQSDTDTESPVLINTNSETAKEVVHMKLTNDQIKVIQDIENNSVIMACPGSGKTTVLINKMSLCCEKEKIME